MNVKRAVKITAVRKADYSDLQEKFENKILNPCSISEGEIFFFYGKEMPEGLCTSAWETLEPFVRILYNGGGNFFDGWMKNEHSAMISCNDGFRPVSFFAEVVEG